MNMQLTSLTLDQQHEALVELCKLQAQVDVLKSQLGGLLNEGTKISCDLGSLAKTNEVHTTRYTAEGERQKKAFVLTLIDSGLAKPVTEPGQVRLTLTKAK